MTDTTQHVVPVDSAITPRVMRSSTNSSAKNDVKNNASSNTSSSSSSSSSSSTTTNNNNNTSNATDQDNDLKPIKSNIGAPIFALSDEKTAAEFKAYREHYRSFRVGNAKGAKGEVSQFVPKTTPHIVPPFLTKLYDMVNCVKYQSLIHWSEDGKAVCITNIKQFSENVLPQYFKHSKFASFLRQLNMYNFYTTRQEPELREFKNPNFVRDDVNLMSLIKRKRAQAKNTNNDGKPPSKRQRLAKGNGTGRKGSGRGRGNSKATGGRGRGSSNNSNDGGSGIPESAARQMQRDLALAVGQATAARTKCSTLQRTVDDCHRELSHLRRKMDNVMSCIEQLCYINGDQTKQLFSSLFENSNDNNQNMGIGEHPSPGSISRASSRSRDGSYSDFLFEGDMFEGVDH